MPASCSPTATCIPAWPGSRCRSSWPTARWRTGLGVIAGWLAVILGLSFYVRKWIGTKTWRWLHRWTLAVYVLALGHTVAAGTDGRSPWMAVLLAVLSAPIAFGLTFRLLPARRRPERHRAASRHARETSQRQVRPARRRASPRVERKGPTRPRASRRGAAAASRGR